MNERHGEIHLDKEAARAGATYGVARYVLLISLGLAIIALSATWMTGAVSSADSGRVAADAAAGQPG